MRALVVLVAFATQLFSQPRRPLKVEDVQQLRTVADPQVSPDGKWVAYTLSTPDLITDKSDTDVWMTSWDGATQVRVTSGKEPESDPRWSPDGKWLSFLSSRADKEKGTQVWLLPRVGG